MKFGMICGVLLIVRELLVERRIWGVFGAVLEEIGKR